MGISVPDKLKELVDHFDNNLSQIKSQQYNETQARREFIDPLFTLLGWDVDNKQGYAEAYKDVIHEDAIKVGGFTKAPDYCFRIGGTRKFFVEAKKPGVNIKEDIDPAYQLRRYAWSSKLPLSILTDFEEFAIYDCRTKPNPIDKSSNGRVKYLNYADYINEWDYLISTFSREAVLKGSFDKYVESNKAKKGTTEVDKAFLTEIEAWRDALARNIALRNPALSTRELNFAVQTTIDRIIFLRICEDRGVEDYAKLMALQNGDKIYSRLMTLFRNADEKYNSGLFHFEPEKGRETHDSLTPGLQIDDKVLKDLLKSLYYPESPYEFSVVPADILGQVYEQFLGKVIRLTAGHQAKVEDKPEVKKAGGVYYTPTYIVDYIVKNTVGKILEGKTPAEISKADHPVRILDPACGSGSFLLGAYEYLLTWYRDQYTKSDPQKFAKGKEPKLYESTGGAWKLTTSERKRILLNHIYGVDIDSQAVEVTKLSLLLKVLEGETKDSVSTQRRLFNERALPDLSKNIKCGNSLIGSDFYKDKQLDLFNEEERIRINAFDWEEEFKEVFKDGGFDVVVGNPPYIRIQALKEWAPEEVEFYKKAYKSASKGNYDIYVVFVERGLQLLNPKGRLGFILPHKFFNAQYGEALRRIIAGGQHLGHVVHFGSGQVFDGATTYTCLMFLDKGGVSKCQLANVSDLPLWRVRGEAEFASIPITNITSGTWGFATGGDSQLFNKLFSAPVKLGDIANNIAQGIRTSANEVYVLDLLEVKRDIVIGESKQLGCQVKLERDAVSSFLQGREIKRYKLVVPHKVVIVPYKIEQGHAKLIGQQEYQKVYPQTFDYLAKNKPYLEQREKGKMCGNNWYGYVYPKNIEIMSAPKILVPDIADGASFALDEAGTYTFTSGYAILTNEEFGLDIKYILGLLNSKLLDYCLKHVSTVIRGGFFRYFAQFLEQLPVRTIDFSNKQEKARHDKLVSLVSSMLSLHKQLQSAKTDQDTTIIQRQITSTDREIDRLVYELYELTPEEIKIVEGEI